MRGSHEKTEIRLDRLPKAPGTVVVRMEGAGELVTHLPAPPKPRRTVTASTKLRRKWAVHEVQWMALTVLLGAACAKCFEWSLSFPLILLSIAGAVFFGLKVYWQGQRMRLFLRGRGKPKWRALATEISTVSSVRSSLIFFGVLGAIVIPKFVDLIAHSESGATLGNLGAIRSALSIYYGDYEGEYPSHLQVLTIGEKYLRGVPNTKLTTARGSGFIHEKWNHIVLGSVPTDVGGWLYNPKTGKLLVNCTHLDSKGSVWTSY